MRHDEWRKNSEPAHRLAGGNHRASRGRADASPQYVKCQRQRARSFANRRSKPPALTTRCRAIDRRAIVRAFAKRSPACLTRSSLTTTMQGEARRAKLRCWARASTPHAHRAQPELSHARSRSDRAALHSCHGERSHRDIRQASPDDRSRRLRSCSSTRYANRGP